jgi:hypothetical protein
MPPISRSRLYMLFSARSKELRDGFDRNTVTSADTRETDVLRYLLSDLHDYHELRDASLLMESLCERAVIESRRGSVESFRFLDDVALYLSAVVAVFEEPLVDDRQAVLPFVGSIVV